MITRREWLTGAAAAIARAADPDFERIDTHNHIHRPASKVVAAMEKTNFRGLSICDSREIGDQPSVLPQMIPGTARFHRESKGRWAWATTFDPRPFEQRDFAGRTIAALRQNFREEAIAVKVWKNVGMGIRSKSGEWLLPDHASLLPIYEAIQRDGKTLICHLAEPDGAWLPLDKNNTERNYLTARPEWHMYNRPGAPSKSDILTARDRVITKYPKLRVVGCHLGSNEEHLDQLAKRLDAMPNFAVDLASRLRYLGAAKRETVLEFVDRYQDRLLYATDFVLGDDEQAGADNLVSRHQNEWNYLAGPAPGLALPQPVLRKIFRENAIRWFPGII